MNEKICTWPDGSQRKVVHFGNDTSGNALILWNERHSTIPGQGCVVGMEDSVPQNWLSEEISS